MGDETYIVGPFVAILPAKVGVIRVAGAVAVFNPGQSYLLSAMLNLNVPGVNIPSSKVPVPKFKHR